ncbi:MAG: hypothetical protein P8013_05725 [Candidatus Sulfobium sp.]
MKPKASCHIRRLPDGEVIGEIVGEDGRVLETRHFGKYTEEDFKRLSSVIKQEMPGLDVTGIEISGN